MSKKTVLLIGGLTHTKKEWDEYASKYTLKVRSGLCMLDLVKRTDCWQEYEHGNRKDFLQKLQGGEFDDVVALYRSNNSTEVRLAYP